MTYIKRIAAVMTVIILAAVMKFSVITASAETLAFITVPESAEQGSSFGISLSFDSDSPIGLIETDLIFDESAASFESGSAEGSGGVLHVKEVYGGDSLSVSVPLTFTASVPGSLTFSLSNCHVSSPDGTPIAELTASASMTVTESSSESDGADTETPPQSDKDENGIPYHGVLKSITVYEGELIPEFSPLIYDYVVKVGHEVEVFEVDAERRSEEDSIWFDGSKKLSDTGTVRTIRVYDDNGHDNTYRIVVQRAPAPEESSESEDVSSEEQEEISSASAVTVTTAAAVPAEISDEEEISTDDASSKKKSSEASSSGASGMSELRRKLMPWLIVILCVLVLALCIIILWIRNRSDRKRRRIKSSSGKQ